MTLVGTGYTLERTDFAKSMWGHMGFCRRCMGLMGFQAFVVLVDSRAGLSVCLNEMRVTALPDLNFVRSFHNILRFLGFQAF